VTRLVARLLGALLLLVLALPLAWRLATGDTYLRVSGDSMRPTYEVGDVLVVQRPAGDELTRVGQVVVAGFGPGGGDAPYVHRVESTTEDGAWLRGDGNDRRDPQPVRQDAVLGTPRLALTGVAADAFTAAQSVPGRVVLVAAAGALLWVGLGGTRRRPPRAAGPRDRHGAAPVAR
jgi:signal peptidase